MDNAVTTSILARCLLDAAFLEQMMQSPAAALEGYALDEKTHTDFLTLDIKRIRNFAGFITKVQHNYLWESFPYTRALLKYYKMEIEVFAAYLERHLQLRAEGVSRNQKIMSFMTFLSTYLASRDSSMFPGVREMLAHELMEWAIRNQLIATVPPQWQTPSVDLSMLGARQFGKMVPLVCGALRVGSFTYDPLQIISHLKQGRFDPHTLSLHPRCLGYWGDSATQQLRILELDDISALLLSHVDGHSSIRTIVGRVTKQGPNGIRVSRFRPFFEAAFKEKLLMVSPHQETR